MGVGGEVQVRRINQPIRSVVAVLTVFLHSLPVVCAELWSHWRRGQGGTGSGLLGAAPSQEDRGHVVPG